MDHAVARVFAQLTTIMNLRGIVNSHITAGDTKVLVEQPYGHRYVHQRQQKLPVYQQEEYQKCVCY